MPVRTPYFKVEIEGEDVSPWVDSVSVTEDDRLADSIAISIPDPRMIYADAIFEGSVATVDLGYSESQQHALLIRATLTEIEVSYPDGGVPTLSLQGEDKSIEMGFEERNVVRRGDTLGVIVKKVVKKYKFAGGVTVALDPDPKIAARQLHQDGKTDLAFLQELAETYRAKCFVELDEKGREVFYFIPERRVVKARRADELVLRYRLGPTSNLISFSPTFDASYLDRRREIADLDDKGKKLETQKKPPTEVVVWKLDETRTNGLASTNDATRIKKLFKAGATRKRELQKALMLARPAVGRVAAGQTEVDLANVELESRRLGMSASGTTTGTIWLRAKSKVKVAGAGERFNGPWYVTSVTHKIDAGGGFKTDFKCVR